MNKTEKKILVILALAQFILTLDSTVMNVSISTLVADLHTTVGGVQTAITFYTLVMAAFMIPGAKIGDLIGRKKAFIIGTIIYGMGSLITSMSVNLGMLLFGWSLLEGVGAALMIPAMLSLIASNYSAGPKRVKAYASTAAIGAVGAAVGPIVGGALTTYATWRLAFLGEVVVVVYILLKRGVIKDSVVAQKVKGFDWRGTIFAASGLGLLVYGILQASSYGLLKTREAYSILGWSVPVGGISPTIVLTALGVLLLSVFVWWQARQNKRSAPALLNLSLLKNKVVRSGAATIFFQLLLLGGVMYGISLYLQMELGYNAMQTGLTLLPLSVMILVLAMRGEKMATKYPSRFLIRVGFLCMLLGSAWLGLRAGKNPSGIDFLPCLALFGAGMGIMASQLQNVVQNSVSEKQSAETSGIMATFQYLGQSFGTAISGVLIMSVFVITGTTLVAQNANLTAGEKAQLTAAIEAKPQIVSDAQLQQATNELPAEKANEVALINSQTRQKALSSMFILLSVVSLAGLLTAQNLPNNKPKILEAQQTP